MNFNDIRVIVRDYVNDIAAKVDQHIVDAVNFLSIVFPQKKIDKTQVTVKNQSYVSKPSNCMRVRRITIDGEPVLELNSFENLDPAETEEIMRWYEDDNKIQLTIPMTSDGEEIKIWYDVSFIVDSGGKWNETQPAGDFTKEWYSVASDSDGSNLIACESYGRLFTSSDSGVTWTERQPVGNFDRNWRSVASDSDGSNLIACEEGGRLYTSSDSGVSWTERQPAGDVNENWRSVASDSDGSNLIAGVYGGRLFTSSDSGVTWTERRPVGGAAWVTATAYVIDDIVTNGDSRYKCKLAHTSAAADEPGVGANWATYWTLAIDQSWCSVASDSDGSNLIACAYGGRLFTSSDSGVSWTERQPAGDLNKNWMSVASDSDGSNLIAGVYGGRLFTSSDSGVSWTERQPAGDVNKNWRSVASNSDGSNLIACAYNGRLYRSADFGVLWEESGLWGIEQNWHSVASDADGSNLIACVYAGRMFIFSDNLEVNVVDLLTELVYVGAAYRYYRKMVSIKVTAPATYPDIELDELRKVLEYWKTDYYKLLDEIKKYKR